MVGHLLVESKLFIYSCILNHVHSFKRWSDPNNLFRLRTEVWEFEKDEGIPTQPELSDGNYRYGIGLYAVDFDFCK